MSRDPRQGRKRPSGLLNKLAAFLINRDQRAVHVSRVSSSFPCCHLELVLGQVRPGLQPLSGILQRVAGAFEPAGSCRASIFAGASQMSDEKSSSPEKPASPPIEGALEAPILYFDEAPLFGFNQTGVPGVLLCANVQAIGPDGKPRTVKKAVAQLRGSPRAFSGLLKDLQQIEALLTRPDVMPN